MNNPIYIFFKRGWILILIALILVVGSTFISKGGESGAILELHRTAHVEFWHKAVGITLASVLCLVFTFRYWNNQ